MDDTNVTKFTEDLSYPSYPSQLSPFQHAFLPNLNKYAMDLPY